MNGDFATSAALGAVIAGEKVTDQDRVGTIAMVAGLAGGAAGLALASIMANEEQQARTSGDSVLGNSPGPTPPPPPTPVPPSPPPPPPPPPPPVDQSGQIESMLRAMKEQTEAMGKVIEALKDVTVQLQEVVAKSGQTSGAAGLADASKGTAPKKG